MAELWERQPGETTKAYEAFCVYRDMGTERSLRKTAQSLNKSLTVISSWSTPNNWVERVQAWDDEQDRIMRKMQQEEIKKMRSNHAKIANQLLVKAVSAMAKIPPDQLTMGDVVRMIESGSKLERISRGDVGDVVENREAEEKQASPVVFYLPDNHRTDEELKYVDKPE